VRDRSGFPARQPNDHALGLASGDFCAAGRAQRDVTDPGVKEGKAGLDAEGHRVSVFISKQ